METEGFVDVKIRGISPGDVEAVLKIRAAISKEDSETDFNKLLEQYTENDENQIILVAEVDGKVVGYMVSTTLYAGFGLKTSAWIMAIGVRPENMGQGLGLKLADQTCKIYKEKGIKSIYSSVVWDSTDVLSFFKKLGFGRSDFINLKKDL